MSDSLFIGTKHELLVASRLTDAGIVISTPLIDVGVDLLASNKSFTKSVPIQVKYKSKETNIFFTGKEITSYESKNVYIAYLLQDSEWYMPFSVFMKNAERHVNRKDGAAYIKLKEKAKDLSLYSGEVGFNMMVDFINAKHVAQT